MEFWESTPYVKWYKSHRRFSFIAKLCIEQYEDKKKIPLQVFQPFLKSLYCHSKGEEKMFQHIANIHELFKEHSSIDKTKIYTEEEKYTLCRNLLIHMKEEENSVKNHILISYNK